MSDNKIKTIDVSKYTEALNNLIGVDSAYFSGDKDVDAIVEIIALAKEFDGIIKFQKTEIDILIRKKETLQDTICELHEEIDRLKEIEYMYNDLCR